MHDRIKELALQAGLQPFEDCGPGYVYKMEKFAELIITECTEQVRGQYVPVIEDEIMMKDTHWGGYVQCGVDSVVAIREHFFGVE